MGGTREDVLPPVGLEKLAPQNGGFVLGDAPTEVPREVLAVRSRLGLQGAIHGFQKRNEVINS